jgi:hypothetical protein
VQPQGYFENEMQFADADGDGDLDLYMAVYTDNQRFIDIYSQQQNIFSAIPQQHIPVPSGVVAWVVGNFLPSEDGDEIVWLAARGVYVRNAAGRAQVLSREPLLLDVPYTFSVPRLNTVADIDGDGLPEMVLLTTTGYQIIQHDGVVSGEIVVKATDSLAPVAASSLLDGKLRATLSSQELSSLFVPNEEMGVLRYPPALFSSVSLPTPIWADVNGDALLDLTYEKENKLYVHLQSADYQFSSKAERVFTMPDSSSSSYEQLEWLNIGGTAAADLLMVRSSEEALSQTRPWQVRVFLDVWQQQDLEHSAAVFKAQSTSLGVQLLDINGDDALDVCMSNWSLDLGLLGRGSPKLTHIASAFLANGDSWNKRPSFAERRSINVDDIESFVTLDSFVPDLTGNGLPDLAELSEKGSLRVRQFDIVNEDVRVASSESIDLPIRALAADVSVKSLNGDEIFDIVIVRSQSLEIYMSVSK